MFVGHINVLINKRQTGLSCVQGASPPCRHVERIAMDRRLYRGKRTDTGEWVEGYLFQENVIIPPGQYFTFTRWGDKNLLTAGSHIEFYFVDPATVGEFTGLADNKRSEKYPDGQPIFEGDIVDVEYDAGYVGVAAERIGLFEVVFHKGCFMKKNEKGLFHFIPSDKCRVVGNVHDDSRLSLLMANRHGTLSHG